MRSRRLCSGSGENCTALDQCGCRKLGAAARCPQCQRPLQEHVDRAAGRLAQILRAKAATIRELLGDMARLAVTRSGPDWEDPCLALEALGRTLHAMAERDFGAGDISPTEDISPQAPGAPSGPVPEEVASRGLGATGAVEVPGQLWEQLAPKHLAWVRQHAPPMRTSECKTLRVLVERLERDGLVRQCAPGLRPNARAYVKPKSADKCSLIIDPRNVNELCAETSGPPQPFRLGHLDQLAALLEVAALAGQEVSFTKLDISNMFWSCRPPAGAPDDAIRFGVGERVYSVCGLPFGWSHSPVIAQAHLAPYLDIQRPVEIIQVQYLDDVLAASVARELLGRHSRDLHDNLQRHNWVVSPKSVLVPTSRLVWMGKELDGESHAIRNSAGYLANTIALWVSLATQGYDRRRLRRLLGKINWMLRPGRGAAPFLAGSYTWLHVGPPAAKYTPPKVLRGLLEALVLGFRPWKAPAMPVMGPRCWTDAAKGLGAYWVGLWGDTGVKIVRCPPWVGTQQAAELFAVEVALRQAAALGLPHIQIVGDNMAAAWSSAKGPATASKKAQNRILRRLQHLLRWTGTQAHVLWVRSEDNPADAPSRWCQFASGVHMAVKGFITEALAAEGEPPRFMGLMRYRA